MNALLLNRLVGLIAPIIAYIGLVLSGWENLIIAKSILATLLILLPGVVWQELRMTKSLQHRFKYPIGFYLLLIIAWSVWRALHLEEWSHNPEVLWYLLPLTALGYFWIHYISNLGKVLKLVWNRHLPQMIFWLIIANLLYWQGLQHFSGHRENYFFTFGGIAVVFVWANLTLLVKPVLTTHWHKMADIIYGGAGTHYIVGFILILMMVALLVVLKLEIMAEQLAVIGYYMLVVGVILEAWALRTDEKISS